MRRFPHIYMWYIYIYISYSYSFPSAAVQCVHSTFSFWSNVFHNWRQESKVFFSYTVMKIELLLPWFSKHQLCLCACVKNRGERRCSCLSVISMAGSILSSAWTAYKHFPLFSSHCNKCPWLFNFSHWKLLDFILPDNKLPFKRDFSDLKWVPLSLVG